MRVGINSQLLSSISVFSSFNWPKMISNSTHRLLREFRADKSLQPIGQAAEFKFESKFKPLLVIWQSSSKSIQKAMEGFECKIKENGLALGAVLQHSLGWSEGQTTTQIVSEPAAVAAGSNPGFWEQTGRI